MRAGVVHAGSGVAVHEGLVVNKVFGLSIVLNAKRFYLRQLYSSPSATRKAAHKLGADYDLPVYEVIGVGFGGKDVVRRLSARMPKEGSP